MASSVDDLKSALTESLEQQGVMQRLRANVRAEVFKILQDDHMRGGRGNDATSSHVGSPPLSNENLLINELIREYLCFNKYDFTHSVLLSEAGQPHQALDRQFLTQELNLRETASSCVRASDTGQPIPLLYSIIHQCIAKSNSSSVLKQ